MESAFRIATRMAMLDEGKIIEEGEPEQLKQSKNPVVAQFLSGSTEGPIRKTHSMQLERNEILTGLLVIGTIGVIAFLLVLLGAPGLFRPLVTYGVYFITPPALNLVR